MTGINRSKHSNLPRQNPLQRPGGQTSVPTGANLPQQGRTGVDQHMGVPARPQSPPPGYAPPFRNGVPYSPNSFNHMPPSPPPPAYSGPQTGGPPVARPQTQYQPYQPPVGHDTRPAELPGNTARPQTQYTPYRPLGNPSNPAELPGNSARPQQQYTPYRPLGQPTNPAELPGQSMPPMGYPQRPAELPGSTPAQANLSQYRTDLMTNNPGLNLPPPGANINTPPRIVPDRGGRMGPPPGPSPLSNSALPPQNTAPTNFGDMGY